MEQAVKNLIPKYEIGDIVRTTKGCRIKGDPGLLKVIKVDKSWGNFEAVVCEKPNGLKRLFLLKNLKKADLEEVEEEK